MEKRRQKELSVDNLRTPKPQEIFIPVAIMCHRYERLTVLQNVFAIILLMIARKDVKKLFEETALHEKLDSVTPNLPSVNLVQKSVN